MTEEVVTTKSSDWKKFIIKHWSIVAVFAVAGILAIAGAIYVYLWFVGNAQSSGMVPSSLGLWTMNNVVTFILHAVFWELLLIGIPVAISAILGWQLWKRLPEEEKREYRFFGKRSRARNGGSGVSILFFVAFAIKVYVDGNWNVTISNWTLDYVVGSMVTLLVWGLVIFGIPMAIGGILWLHHEMNKKP
jgi:hypothetical protein